MMQKNIAQNPIITLTLAAKNQLKLMILNDYTLTGKKFRIQISGKECFGFTYSAGFTLVQDNNLTITLEDIDMVIDPFSAFYLKEFTVDYQFDFENGTEGFVISNKYQEDFSGKFWKSDPSKIPPLETNDI